MKLPSCRPFRFLALPLLMLLSCFVLTAQDEADEAEPVQGSVRVYGEFEDWNLFEAALIEMPEMKGWSDKELWDGLSGATLQAKTLETEVPDRMVYLGKTPGTKGEPVIAYADGFGQYWFRIQPGTWTITGSCEGYAPQTRTISVKDNETVYVNFFLQRLGSK